jgi:proline iminopeptidase
MNWIKNRTTKDIALYSAGFGTDLLLILGGPGIGSRVYREFLGPLTKYLRVHLLDLRGTGESRSEGPFGFHIDLADIDDAIKVLNLSPSAYILAGHSYGGLPALQYALSGSVSPGGLVLLSTSAKMLSVVQSLNDRKSANLGAEKAAVFGKAILAIVENKATDADQKTFLELEFTNHFRHLPTPVLQRFMSNLEFSFPVFTTHSDWLSIDLEPMLKQIQVPSLILSGQNDIIVPPIFSDALMTIPKTQRFDATECGHWLFVEQPAFFVEKLTQFASEIFG